MKATVAAPIEILNDDQTRAVVFPDLDDHIPPQFLAKLKAHAANTFLNGGSRLGSRCDFTSNGTTYRAMVIATSRQPGPTAEPASMPNQRTNRAKVDLWLSEEEKAALEESEHYTPATRGRVSGYAAAVRAILREHLGMPPASDPHREQSAKLKGKPRKEKGGETPLQMLNAGKAKIVKEDGKYRIAPIN
jgi:hypothetical protein